MYLFIIRVFSYLSVEWLTGRVEAWQVWGAGSYGVLHIQVAVSPQPSPVHTDTEHRLLSVRLITNRIQW